MAKKKVNPKSLAALKPAAYNPRTINDRARHGLSRSIEKFGDLSGITYNTATGNLVTGHQRVTELRQLYGDLAINPDGYIHTPDGNKWHVRLVDWSLDMEIEANLIANNPSIGGQFTADVIALLDRMKEISPDFETLSLEDIYRLPLHTLTSQDLDDVTGEDEDEDENAGTTGDQGDHVSANFLLAEEDRDQLYRVLNEVRERQKITQVSQALMYLVSFYSEHAR